jgi:hypothetical protein
MKRNFMTVVTVSSLIIVSSMANASADPTYAVLDANGNVTNIIVCGSACASGEFGGNKVVLQVAADPVTGENRGGFWQGPGTTTYDSNSGTFTMVDKGEVTNSSVATDTDSTITSSATIFGGKTTTFKYEDTIGSKLETRQGFDYGYLDTTKASISVKKEYIEDEMANIKSESMTLVNRMTEVDLTEAARAENKTLIIENIMSVVRLLNTWMKVVQGEIK